MQDKSYSDYRTGIICVIGCQLFWGVCPIYWQALMPIPSWIIILYRIVTMFVYSYIAARFRFSREEIWGPLKDRVGKRSSNCGTCQNLLEGFLEQSLG